jgi:hypothetical protein
MCALGIAVLLALLESRSTCTNFPAGTPVDTLAVRSINRRNDTLEDAKGTSSSSAAPSTLASIAPRPTRSRPSPTPPAARRALVVSPPAGWRTIAPHPVGVLEGAAVWHEGELWTLAGHPCTGARNFDTTNVFAYNESSNAWLPRPRLPVLHHIFSAAFSTPGRITVIGGLEALTATTHRANEYVHTLDTTTAARTSALWAWERSQIRGKKNNATPRPDGIITCTPRLDAQTQLAYCIAGATSNFVAGKMQPSRHFLSFDPVRLKVGGCAAPPPAAQSNHATLLSAPGGGRVILLQGRDDLSDAPKSNAVFVYAISTDSWAHLSELPQIAQGFDTRVAWQHPTKPWALLFGGQDASSFTTTALVIRVDFGRTIGQDAPLLEFSPFSAVPYTVSGPVIVALGGDDAPTPLRLAVVGGAHFVGVYCVSTCHAWLVQPDLPAARAAMDVVHSGSGAQPANSTLQRQLTVVAAFYGPYVVTSALQRLLDAGVLGIHMGGGPAGRDPHTRSNAAIVDLPDFGIVSQFKGAEALNAVVRSADGALRTVSCARDGACLF